MTTTFLVAMGAPQGGQGGLATLLLPAIILGIFYLIVIMPMKKRQQKVADFLAALKEGDKVVTSGGIYGTITRVGEQALQLQVAERVRIDVSRNAIVGYQGQEPVAPEGTGSSS
jgi:preprotein translocase subunit YajC